ALTFQNHTNCPLTDLGGKTSIFSHPVYLFLREFRLQDFRGGSAACPLLLDKIITIHRVKQVVTASLKLRDYDAQVAEAMPMIPK
ncbi:hypothetical protein MMT35_15480, partial [Escherichia coli]|nr:hypothetical protein [Escherichia coli]